MINGFFEKYKNQSLREKNSELDEADEAIALLKAREQELLKKVAHFEETIAERDHEILVRKALYLGLEAERDAILKKLDECSGGAENNPMRQPVDKGPDFFIANGPRKGQTPQMRGTGALSYLLPDVSTGGGVGRPLVARLLDIEAMDTQVLASTLWRRQRVHLGGGRSRVQSR